MASILIILSAILTFVTVQAADNWEFGNSPDGPPPVTEECLECICQATSGCKQGEKCANSMCGMFHITRPYWIDAFKPKLNESAPERPGLPQDYPDCASDPDCAECTNDPECAVRTVRSYMKRFPQDCNEDGQVNCFDYMAIHMKGGYECGGELPFKYVNVFNQCVAALAAQRG